MPDLTLAAALFAGLLSFLSPCVLPVVPAYLGQLGVAAAGGPSGAANGSAVAGGAASPSPVERRERWRAMPRAVAFVFGFGTVFTLLGLTAYVAAGPIRENLPLLRQVGGILVILLGLNLMGILRLSRLTGSWRPLDRFLFGRGRLGSSPIGAFALGTVFAIGWTPCIGPTLGAILTLSAVGATPQAALGFVAYSIGLAVPFLVLAVGVDRVQPLLRPIQRHGRLVELIGGGLVVLIGLAILFDFLALFARSFTFLWPQV